jgi:hypothetical protein
MCGFVVAVVSTLDILIRSPPRERAFRICVLKNGTTIVITVREGGNYLNHTMANNRAAAILSHKKIIAFLLACMVASVNSFTQFNHHSMVPLRALYI